LQWLNECGEVKVTKHELISFAIRKYSNEIMCDVVPMHASHLLLGPWQFDRKAIHDGFRNRFTIVKDGKTITLVPLSPKQVYGKSENAREPYHVWQERNARIFAGMSRTSNLVFNQIECIIRDKLDLMRNVVPTNENKRIQRAWRVNTIDS